MTRKKLGFFGIGTPIVVFVMPKRISRETRTRVKIVTRSTFIPDGRSLSTCLILILGHQYPVVTCRPLSFHIISTGPGGTDTPVYWLGRKGIVEDAHTVAAWHENPPFLCAHDQLLLFHN